MGERDPCCEPLPRESRYVIEFICLNYRNRVWQVSYCMKTLLLQLDKKQVTPSPCGMRPTTHPAQRKAQSPTPLTKKQLMVSTSQQDKLNNSTDTNAKSFSSHLEQKKPATIINKNKRNKMIFLLVLFLHCLGQQASGKPSTSSYR